MEATTKRESTEDCEERTLGRLTNSGRVEGRLQLSDAERVVLGELLRVNQACELGITFRVVGGWVRDKLLGRFSNDLDVALSRDRPLASGVGVSQTPATGCSLSSSSSSSSSSSA
eukprot:CAMPEP_0177656652 /NCGR_PEP_ID=MMETSP0447-20121125/15699_1 /TAXON_ID=0 /ORGANISM="Stygamoeba regulata, Strain BSH-02190019" /LENGTH=114 /DNA_ID=CAMNT_0019160821 /DNA_START=118 /DNA_END=459 /DNA_ORIENTATION=-